MVGMASKITKAAENVYDTRVHWGMVNNTCRQYILSLPVDWYQFWPTQLSLDSTFKPTQTGINRNK